MKNSVIIKIFVLSCFLLCGIACERLSAGKIRTPVVSGENPALPEDVIVEASDPAEVVRKAYEKMSTVRSYRSRHEMTGLTGASTTTETEVVAPDRVHSIQTPTGIEIVAIGDDFYIKTTGSGWKKSGLFISKPGDLPQAKEMINESLKNICENVKAVGSDTFDGKSVMVYQCSLPTLPQEKDEQIMKLWIGARDNLIYKYEYESETRIGDKPFKIKSVMKFYDFGADIKIEPPI